MAEGEQLILASLGSCELPYDLPQACRRLLEEGEALYRRPSIPGKRKPWKTGVP